ncbi:hypothetical protein ACIRSJ_32120 [Streptomyces virginiae]|uniref:hypothetical protein n=1 Tax=Streptomyces virginiae TaxID=1961 RepID=UPI00380B0E80
MSADFLIDTSALVRSYRRQVGPERDRLVESGRVGLCEPVRQEFLRAVGGRAAYDDFESVAEITGQPVRRILG